MEMEMEMGRVVLMVMLTGMEMLKETTQKDLTLMRRKLKQNLMRREEELDAAPPAWSGQTGLRDRSDRSPGEIGDGLGTLAREGPCQGRRT